MSLVTWARDDSFKVQNLAFKQKTDFHVVLKEEYLFLAHWIATHSYQKTEEIQNLFRVRFIISNLCISTQLHPISMKNAVVRVHLYSFHIAYFL